MTEKSGWVKQNYLFTPSSKSEIFFRLPLLPVLMLDHIL
jgi:hypothetical protein